jgi:DNA helicase-2/ATP-dependent DNA helicase PcrA
LFPHARTLVPDEEGQDASSSAAEEERRLLYVGVTRARAKLYLTRALRRNLGGKVRRDAR